MKSALLIMGLVFVSLSAQANVTKEVWACKNPDANDIPKYLNVVVDRTKNQSSGVIDDNFISGADLALTQEKNGRATFDSLYALTAQYDDRDHSYYRVELIPTIEDANYNGMNGLKKAQGKAVVVSDITRDCLGESEDATVLLCEIQVTSDGK